MDRQMMTRLLPPAEWSKLAGTELESVWPILNPADAHVLVVEDEAGQILGCWAAIRYVHVEGLYIAPRARGKASVARHLLTGMRALVGTLGASVALTAATSDPVRRLLRHAGATLLPGDHYAVPMGVS